MESAVYAHKIIHDVVVNKGYGFIFELDYEKAYDMVSREFLISMMPQRGFSQKWIKLIQSLLFLGSFGVIINDINSHFFETCRGVR